MYDYKHACLFKTKTNFGNAFDWINVIRSLKNAYLLERHFEDSLEIIGCFSVFKVLVFGNLSGFPKIYWKLFPILRKFMNPIK